MSVYGRQQARAQRMIAEQRSAELEKVAAFQQSMLEGIDIEAIGIGMAAGMRGQAAKATPDAADAVEEELANARTADIARDLIDHHHRAGADPAIARALAEETERARHPRQSV